MFVFTSLALLVSRRPRVRYQRDRAKFVRAWSVAVGQESIKPGSVSETENQSGVAPGTYIRIRDNGRTVVSFHRNRRYDDREHSFN